MLALLFIAGSASLSASPLVIPQQQAAHFCRLFVSEGSSLSTLSRRAHQMMQSDDSLSVEQIFAGYILLADGWQTMRLFPHQENGVVSWYSATDKLPASIGSEHQKYIQEVFPRLVAEVQTGDWETVDAYIDRMIQYQCQFGGSKLPSRPSSAAIVGIFLLFLALICSIWFKTINCYCKLIIFFIEKKDLTTEVVENNQNLILGTSTWGAGELQDDWYDGLRVLQAANLADKTIALFGCGDCESYGDTFVGGIGELYNGIKESGANFVGAVSTDGYTFDDSEAVVDGKFVGLPLDDVNEDDKTDARIDAWIAEISPNL